MGTTAAAYSQQLATDTARAGGRYVEAPVSGSRVPAEAGQLVGMVAGLDDAVDLVLPLLDPVCSSVVRCGEVPKATRLKLAVNLFLITQVTGLVEAFHFAALNGLDPDLFRSAVDAGPMASAVSRLKLGQLVAGEGIHGVSSWGKYLTTQSIGFGAAWPRPQIDASRITSDRSASSGRSQRSLAISSDALAVPLRHGVHWPHDSCSKKRIVLRAAPTALSWSDSTTTAAEPMKQP